MTALDTNVVVRIITKDDEEQLRRAEALIEAGPCVVSETVLLEAAWVLKSSFGASYLQIEQDFRALLGMRNVHAAHPQWILQALDGIVAGLDAADAFHRASVEDAERLVTLDRTFVRKAKGIQGIPVELL